MACEPRPRVASAWRGRRWRRASQGARSRGTQQLICNVALHARRCPAEGAPLAVWRCAQHGPRLGADSMADGLGAVGAAIARGEGLEGAVVAHVADFEAKLLAKYDVCGGGPDGDERQESGVECEGVCGPGFGVEEELRGRLHVRGLHVQQDEDEEREGEGGSIRLPRGVWQAVDPEAKAKVFVEGIAVGWRFAGLETGARCGTSREAGGWPRGLTISSTRRLWRSAGRAESSQGAGMMQRVRASAFRLALKRELDGEFALDQHIKEGKGYG
ncbi:unnamed protein product [Prorocentrum cordatum]|uniref:Uncharacterized protein n=1 Tax=Prorocentrum cordatum TaxID=2364126 RepID=A0ABN9VBW2_9DINO|nr:unnamed protein product [Polarella glacialis]